MYVRDSLEDKSMLLVHFKNVFPLTLPGHSFYRLLFHFESYQGIPLFLHRQSRPQDGEHFANDQN